VEWNRQGNEPSVGTGALKQLMILVETRHQGMGTNGETGASGHGRLHAIEGCKYEGMWGLQGM